MATASASNMRSQYLFLGLNPSAGCSVSFGSFAGKDSNPIATIAWATRCFARGTGATIVDAVCFNPALLS